MLAGAVHTSLALGGGPTPGAVTTGEAPFFQERSFALAGRNQQPEAFKVQKIMKALRIDAEFQEFWAEYPRHVGKLAARKAYERARRLAAADVILEGVRAYKRHMPQEERFRVHPTTFLNQGRWEDEYPEHRQAVPAIDWFQECAELHAGECGLNRWRHHERMEIEAMKRAMK